MKNIYYSIVQIQDGDWVSLTLCETTDGLGAFVPGELNDFTRHASEDDARMYCAQLKKPAYFELFGSNYAVIECDPASDFWAELMTKWDLLSSKLDEVINMINEEMNRPQPWYIRAYNRAVSYIK